MNILGLISQLIGIKTLRLAGMADVTRVLFAAGSSSQTQSAVEMIIPGEVAAFFERFEERAPNPFPD